MGNGIDRQTIKEMVQRHSERADYLASIGKLDLAGIESSEEMDALIGHLPPKEQLEFLDAYAEIQRHILGLPADEEVDEHAAEEPSCFWLRDSTVSEMVLRHVAINLLASKSDKESTVKAAEGLVRSECITASMQAPEGKGQLFWDLYSKHSKSLSDSDRLSPGKPKPIAGIGEYWTDRASVRIIAKRHAQTESLFLSAAGGNAEDERYKDFVSTNLDEIKCLKRSLADSEKSRFDDLYRHEREIATAEERKAQADLDVEAMEQARVSARKAAEWNQLTGVVIPIIVMILIFMWITDRL